MRERGVSRKRDERGNGEEQKGGEESVLRMRCRQVYTRILPEYVKVYKREAGIHARAVQVASVDLRLRVCRQVKSGRPAFSHVPPAGPTPFPLRVRMGAISRT